MNDEGALIAFTLLSQLIIGSTLVYVLFYFISMEDISLLSSGFSLKTPELLLLIGLSAAICISLFHLGRPTTAVHALNNLKTSWISREILTVTLFSLSLVMLFVARWLGSGKAFLNVSFVAAAIAGVLLLVTMTKLYMITGVITWNNWLTPVNFTLTTLISGLAFLLVFILVFNIEFIRLKPLVLTFIVLLLFEMLHSGLLYSQLNTMDFNHTNQFIADGAFKFFLITRIALIGLGILLLLFVAFRNDAGNSGTLLILSLSLVFVEMIIGRFVFFAVYVRTGI